MDVNKLSPEAKAFFDSLTPAMKEAIMQTGVNLSTKNDLERYVQNSLSGAPGVTVNL
ncbi:MAG: hypothetical protein J6I98_07440 [Clostridia bacterium]|nr:hypothetical protein [Clostridia bacterium]